MKTEPRNELLYEALETELGGVQVYRTSLTCVVNKDLEKEWSGIISVLELWLGTRIKFSSD